MRTAILWRSVLFAGLWLALSAGDAGSWLFGLPAAAAAVALSLRLLPPSAHTWSPGHALRVLLDFARGSWAGGLDVARRALDPRMPLHPGWVRHRLVLEPGPSRTVLGDLLSLMPGTLAAGQERERLLVHCLDTQGPVQATVARHERSLGAALGQAQAPEPPHG